MGLFSKKKNAEVSDSVLTESEIRKKLYGEFNPEVTHVGTGENDDPREHSMLPALSPESLDEKGPDPDLFSAQRDALTGPDLSSRQTFSEQKPADQTPRYVPLHDFEKPAGSPVSGTDPYSRFRNDRPSRSKANVLLDLGKGFLGKLSELFDILLDPKRVALRRFFYWGVAVLVVFLLFWGVNTLNSRREEAMRTRYKMPVRVITAKAPVVVVPAPVVEREVVMTTASVQPKTVFAPEAATSLVSGPYVVQVVTYPTQKDADQIAAVLKRDGFRSFVQERARSGDRVYYVVLMGGFRTAAEAKAQLLKFKDLEVAQPFQDAFVRTNRS